MKIIVDAHTMCAYLLINEDEINTNQPEDEMGQDIFEQLERKTIDALEGAVSELTQEIGLKFRSDFLKSLPVPYASLCWHDGELQVIVSFQDTADGFGEDIVQHVVELGIGSGDLSAAVFNASGSFLSAEDSRECASFLRKLADAVDASHA